MKTLVLGLGNPILTDDGVGIHVVRAVASHFANPQLLFAEASVGGLRLLDVLTSYDRVLMVDAILTLGGTVGDVYRFRPGDLQASRHSGSSHDLTLCGALALGRRLGMELPDDENFDILAVEVEDVLSFGEECTPAVTAAIPRVAQMIVDEIAALHPEIIEP